jgi:hypothetical protein
MAQPVNLLSVDVESNGLYGQPFAIGAIVGTQAGPWTLFLADCPIEGPVDPWVAEHVLPVLDDRAVMHFNDLPNLLGHFGEWWDRHRTGATVVAHIAQPVEARMFADLIHIIGRDPFSGPFPLHDVATLLLAAGENPESVDTYIARHGIDPGKGFTEMGPHNPLYDARVAQCAAWHLLDRLTIRDAPPPGHRDILGETAYAAYGDVTDGRTHQGDPMPDWSDLGDTIRAAWRAAATAAVVAGGQR